MCPNVALRATFYVGMFHRRIFWIFSMFSRSFTTEMSSVAFIPTQTIVLLDYNDLIPRIQKNITIFILNPFSIRRFQFLTVT